MLDELLRLTGTIEQAPKKVFHGWLDADLLFVADYAEIRDGTGIPLNSLSGRSLVEVFPELRGHEDIITQVCSNPEGCFVYAELHRRSVDKRDRYFELQIAPLGQHEQPHEPQYLLALVDVTQHVLIKRQLREVKSIPALITTTEEIRQNLDALERWNHALVLLNRAGQVFSMTLEAGQILDQLLQVAMELTGAEGSSVWLWDESDPEYLICQASVHEDPAATSISQRLHIGQGIAGWVAETGESVSGIKADGDPRFLMDGDADGGFSSVLVVPLKARDTIIGVLELVNKGTGDFGGDDLAVAETLASSASTAFDNARLVSALQRQAEDLRARNDELDAFAHTVAHDLQNPLSQIMGFSDILQREQTGLNVEVKQRALSSIADNAEKMSEIVRELLLLASVRKTDVQLQPLQMEHIVEAAMSRVSHLMREYQAEVRVPTFWPKAMGHAPWVEEIWENYLSNAVKYGGRPPQIEIGGSELPDGMVRYWVRDNGPGLSQEDQEQLFSPFTRLENNGQEYGHGLGLSIVWRITDKLGGKVSIESLEGRGSIFSFTLPRCE